MKVTRWQFVTRDVAHRAGVTIMQRRENGQTVFAAFNTGKLDRVMRDGERVEGGSYAACVAALF
jgi:hypothetical protein